MTHSDPMSPGRPARFLALALGLSLILVLGCGGGEAETARMARRPLEVAEVPEAPMEAAREALPGIAFENAWRNVDAEGRLQSYEIRGQSAETGKIREVRVSPSGEILEME